MDILEKYRPRSWGEVIGQAEVVRKLRWLIDSRYRPNMIFKGPRGVGKRIVATMFRNECNNNEYRTLSRNPEGEDLTYLDDMPYIVLLDNEHTPKLPQRYNNDSVIFRFKPVPDDVIYPIILDICGKEGIEPPREIKGRGSIRRAILSLFEPEYPVDIETVQGLLRVAVNEGLEPALVVLNEITAAGYSPRDILDILIDYTIHNENLKDERARLFIVKKLGECERNIYSGCSPEFQLKCLLAEMCLMKKGRK